MYWWLGVPLPVDRYRRRTRSPDFTAPSAAIESFAGCLGSNRNKHAAAIRRDSSDIEVPGKTHARKMETRCFSWSAKDIFRVLKIQFIVAGVSRKPK